MSVATVAVFATVCRATGVVPKNPSLEDADEPMLAETDPRYA